MSPITIINQRCACGQWMRPWDAECRDCLTERLKDEFRERIARIAREALNQRSAPSNTGDE